MKKLITVMLFGTILAPAFSQWAVLDVANLKQSVTNYAMMGQQLAKQATQITNQVQQIQQFEMQLKRLGDMSTLKKLVGFPQFRLDLNLPTKVKTWADGLKLVDGRGLFGDTRGGIYREINFQFPDFDGMMIGRDAQIFKEAQDMTVSVDEFKAVQSDVYTRREDLKRAIAETSEALQAADTDAEEQKLSAVLNAQYDADAEARRRLAQQEVKKISAAFKPRYECLLQYVKEQRLAP